MFPRTIAEGEKPKRTASVSFSFHNSSYLRVAIDGVLPHSHLAEFQREKKKEYLVWKYVVHTPGRSYDQYTTSQTNKIMEK